MNKSNVFYVYVLKSVSHPDKTYIGYTPNITQRLENHNAGKSIYTAKYKPWKFLSYIVFSDEQKALDFEKYLKSGSGKVFIKNHFI